MDSKCFAGSSVLFKSRTAWLLSTRKGFVKCGSTTTSPKTPLSSQMSKRTWWRRWSRSCSSIAREANSARIFSKKWSPAGPSWSVWGKWTLSFIGRKSRFQKDFPWEPRSTLQGWAPSAPWIQLQKQYRLCHSKSSGNQRWLWTKTLRMKRR